MNRQPESLDVEAVYRRHGPAVLRRARQILGSESEALDVLQEIFLGLLRDPGQFAGRSSITTWLYSVTTNHCLNRLRDSRNRQRLLEQRVLPVVPLGESPRPEHADVRDLLRRIPEAEAQAAIYHYFDGMSYDEIAELMGCSRRHVGNLLNRIRQRINEEHAHELAIA